MVIYVLADTDSSTIDALRKYGYEVVFLLPYVIDFDNLDTEVKVINYFKEN